MSIEINRKWNVLDNIFKQLVCPIVVIHNDFLNLSYKYILEFVIFVQLLVVAHSKLYIYVYVYVNMYICF